MREGRPASCGRALRELGAPDVFAITAITSVHLIYSALNFGDSFHQWPSGAAGFGPRLLGLKGRLVGRSMAARKPSSPGGRPNLAAARRRADKAGPRSLGSRSGEVREAPLDGGQGGTSLNPVQRKCGPASAQSPL